MSKPIAIEIIEFVNGRPSHLWYGLQECAYHHHVHPLNLKKAIYYGTPLSGRPDVTFDIAPECGCDIELVGDAFLVVNNSAPGNARAKEE